MKRRVYEKGDAMAVVFGALVVLLMAALGVIFYQNFIAKKADTANQSQNADASQNKTLLSADVAFKNDIYRMDYPEGWEAETKKPEATDAKSAASSITITSPNKDIHVAFLVFEDKVADQPCDSTDGLKVRYYNAHSVPVKKLTGTSLFVVEAMTDYKGGGYKYAVGLAPEGGMTHASVGDSHCTVASLGNLTDLNGDGSSLNSIAKIDFPKLPNVKDSKVSSMDELKGILATDDYKAAVKILESIRKE